MKSITLFFLFFGSFVMANEVITLDNSTKSTLIYEQDTSLSIVSMKLVFKQSGSIKDGKQAGLAKVVSRLLGEGTKTYGAIAFAETLESKAIVLSFSSGIETSLFELSVLKSEFKYALQAFKSLLKDPNFTQKSLDKVKTKLISSILQKKSNFDYVASTALNSLLFKDTALAHSSLGTVESIKSITLDDVKKFYKTHMVQSQAIAVVGGDISELEAKKAVSELLDLLPKGKKSTLPYIKTSNKAENLILKENTKQAFIYFGAPLYVTVNDINIYKAKVAIYILGAGGFGSRLMEEIRVKRGLAYSIYAQMSVNNSHSYLIGYLQTKLTTGDKALKIVKKEFKRFVKDGVTQVELNDAKAFLLGSEPLRTETLSQRLSRKFTFFYNGLPLDYNIKQLQLIKDLTLNDLNNFIKKHKEILDLSVAMVTK